MRQLLLFGGAAMLIPVFTPRTAAAADEAPQASAQVSEIVVTAFRRSDSAQKLPASISAVTGETMSRQGIDNIRDLANLVPNLDWGEHFGTTLITLRGIGSNVDSGVTEPTIALYVDGIYLPRSDMATLRAVDLDRVEVLRGPQGTLYGRNAIGGAINFVSPSPTNTLTGGISVSGGSRNSYSVSGYVSGPIGDRLQVRASGGYDHDDGYVKILNTGQTLNGVDDFYARIAARAEVTDNVTVDLAVRYDRNYAATAYQQPLPGFALAPAIPNAFSANYGFAGLNKTLVVSGIVN
jgi:iron complex outermembrane receptor protein